MRGSHPSDPIHPFSDADRTARELPHARMVEAKSISEWRLRPERQRFAFQRLELFGTEQLFAGIVDRRWKLARRLQLCFIAGNANRDIVEVVREIAEATEVAAVPA